MRKFMRNNFSAFVLSFVLVMSFVSSSNAADITLSSAVVINSSNKSQYEGKSVAGTIPSDSSAGGQGFFISQGAIVVDGIELNLTIDGLNADYSEKYSMLSGISLVNGATLHLTVNGENTLTAGYGGAGIAVPDGTTLEITAESTGTLNATGGKNYGGGAGIGSIGNGHNTSTTGNESTNYLNIIQGLGDIIINGGTINARGGTWYNYYTPVGGAAGIGSSEFSGMIDPKAVNESAFNGDPAVEHPYRDTTYINNVTGSITINDGTINAKGGNGAAGIGGGNNGTLRSITINGGTVTAAGSLGAAIGTGWNGNTDGSSLSFPNISITGGLITANGSIGSGGSFNANQYASGKITLSPSALYSLSDTVIYAEKYCAQTVEITGGNTWGINEFVIVHNGEAVGYCGTGFVPDVSKIDGKTLISNAYISSLGNVNISQTQNGSVTADLTQNVPAGHTVTLTITPETNYILHTLTVKDFYGNTIPVKDNTFIMQMNGSVTVSATFDSRNSVINITPSEHGTVYTENVSALAGETVWLTVTPEDGYRLSSLTVKDAGGNDVAVTNNSFVMPNGNVTITAEFAAIYYTITTGITGEGGTVATDHSTARKGDTVTLTLNTNDGCSFVGLTVKDENGNEITVTDNAFTMPSGNVTVEAAFQKIPYYDVTIQPDAYNRGAVYADRSFAYAGDTVTLTVRPYNDKYFMYELDTLSVKDSAGNEIPVTDSAFTMPSSNVTVNATFRTVGSNNPRYRIDVQTTGKGSVYVDMRIIGDNIERYVNSAYAHKKIILNVYPYYRFSLSSLTVKDKLGYTIPVADDNTFYMPASDVTVEAVFKEDGDYSIAVQTIGNGQVSLNKSRANEGDSVSVNAVPSHGNKLDSLTVRDSEGNDVSVENGTFTMPASNVTVEAIFKEDGYSIAVQKVGNGQVSLNRSRANEGDTVRVIAVPLKGSTLDSLMVRDSAGNTITMRGHTFTMPADNVTVEAVFKEDRYSIVVRKFGNGQVSLNRSRANEGDTVGVNAVPSSGNVLDSLRVKDSNWKTITMTNNTFTMPASDVTVEAVFKKEDSGGGSEPPVGEVEHNITVQIIGSGQVSVSSNTAKAGDTITMDIAPSSGNTLGSLTVKYANGNDVSITNNTFTMPASDVTVKAVFEEVRYSITVNAEHGKVIAPSSARPGTSVTLTPVPDGGYRFVSMTVDGENFTGGAFVMPEHNVTVSAVFSSYYIGANGKEQELPEGTQTMTSSTTEWSGWYLVQDSVTISGRVSVNGEAHVILADGACLTVTEGINVANKDSSSDSLTIYGQTDGTGELIASGGTDQAGIGGNSGENCGIVTINGGRVTAIGGFLKKVDNVNHGTNFVASGAGIGGGSGGNGGTVTINGGRVTAAYCTRNGGVSITGLLEKDKGAGIGGGVNGSGGTLVIGWTNQNDSLVASGYTGTVRIKDGQFMTDGKENYYAGEVSDVSAIANKTLVPAVEVRSITVVTNGVSVSKTLAKQGEEVILVPSIGYEIVSASYNNGFIIQPDRMGTCKFIMPDNDVEVSAVVKISSEFGATDDYTPDGTESKPYVISTANGWNMFCDLLNVENFAGKFLKLSGDLMVTRMAGSDTHSFKGTFDGSGHTLTVSYDIAEDKAAPFRYVDDGCVIKNLHVAGNITIVSDDTLHKYAAGLIGQLNANSNVSIDNCRVSVTITDTQTENKARYHGGFVAYQAQKSKLNMTGCVFDGKLLGEQANSCGGFVGKGSTVVMYATTTNITNSLFAPSEIKIGTAGSATFVHDSKTINVTNSYYTQPFNTAQGKQGYAVTAGEGITIALASENVGVSFDGKVYAGSGETMSLTIASSNGQYAIKSCTASAGTLTESDGTYSLTMPAENVTITAELELVGYAVRFDEGIAEGLMTADKETATYGETVTLTVKAGYEAENVTVMDGETSIAVTKNADGTYSFTMPLGDVRVTATVRATEYEITYNLDGGEVSTANPAKYTITTATFTLNNPTKDGYTFTGWTGTGLDAATKTVTIPIGSTGNRTYTAGFEKNLSYWGKTDSNTPDGTGENPYIISTVDGWNLLVKELNSGNSYSGKVFSLNDDLTVTTMLGTNGTGFAGTFEGNGTTLTFNYEGADDYVAPFRYVNGGTIKDLTVSGTIKTSGQYAGGIVGQSSGNTTIEACNFVGKLLTTNVGVTIGGGFVAENNGTLTISNSLYAPATLSDGETEPSATGTTTFSRNTESHTSEIMNSYYTRKLGTEQGKQGYTVTAETGITVALAEDSANGLTYDGTIYAGSNETVSLTISGGDTKDGYTFKGYKASTGTLTESGGKYSLTMPEGNVTISAKFAQLYSVTISEAITNGTITADKTQAIEDETITLTVAPATGYVVSVVKYNGTVINPVEGVYSFVMPTENVTLTAEFSVVNYEVGGLNDNLMTADKTTANYGDVVTLTPAEGYEAENLTVMAGDSVVNVTVNADGTYTFTMPAGAVTVNFTLKPITYHITYSGVDGAAFTAQNPTEYTIESESFTLNNPTKDGYTFTGWILDGGNDEPAITVTIATGTTGNLAYTANWQKNGFSPQDSNTPEFAYHSLILSGQIGVIFYVYAPEGLASKDFCVYFDVSGDKLQNTQPVYAFETMTEDGKNFLCFNCYINSVQMADKIHAELHYKDTNASEKTITHDYTAKQYLSYIIDDTTQAADTIALGKAIMDFGSYVQPVLAKENGWEIGKNHAEMTPANNYDETDFNKISEDTAAYAIQNGNTESSGIAKVEFALMLDSETTILLYLTTKSDYSGNVSAYVDSNKTNNMAVKYGNNYTVSIGNISAHELGKTHTVEITTQYPNVASDSFTVGISALSYVQGAIHNDDTDLKRAVTSLYRYYDATMTYRNNRPDTYGSE